MARDGYKIFNSDTHVGPDARILAGYLEGLFPGKWEYGECPLHMRHRSLSLLAA